MSYLPPSAEGVAVVNTITVGVSDGFNGADDDDVTLYIVISVTEQQPAPITSSFVGITGCGKLDRLFAGRRSQRLLVGGRSVRRHFLQY